MAKKTVRPDAPAGSFPTTPGRRRAPSNGRRTTTRRAAPGNGAVTDSATVGERTLDTAADMRIAADVDSSSGRTPSYDEIAEAAYRRYLERGGEHGRDFDDWVEAERSLRSRD